MTNLTIVMMWFWPVFGAVVGVGSLIAVVVSVRRNRWKPKYEARGAHVTGRKNGVRVVLG